MAGTNHEQRMTSKRKWQSRRLLIVAVLVVRWCRWPTLLRGPTHRLAREDRQRYRTLDPGTDQWNGAQTLKQPKVRPRKLDFPGPRTQVWRPAACSRLRQAGIAGARNQRRELQQNRDWLMVVAGDEFLAETPDPPSQCPAAVAAQTARHHFTARATPQLPDITCRFSAGPGTTR